MIESIIKGFDIWTDAQGVKSKGRVKSIDNINLEGIARLRELVLKLAVHGKLVKQDPAEGHALDLLNEIDREKIRLEEEGIIKKSEKSTIFSNDEVPFKIPGSWIWTRLTDVYYSISPSGKKLKTSEIIEAGRYPVVDQGKSTISGYTNNSELLIELPGPVIIFGDHTKEIKYIDFNFVAGADGTKILRPYKINERYFFFFLFTCEVEERGYSRHFKYLNENLFALPPLNEQNRIVEKVNELMTLCDKLEEEQTKNLTTHNHLVESLLEKLTQANDADDLQTAWMKLADHFDALFCTEDSIEQLKETIIQLALRGKLTKQDQKDENAIDLKNKIFLDFERLAKEGTAKKLGKVAEINKEEIPYSLPINWTWVRLQEIIQISSGDGLTASNMNSNGEIPVYGGNGVNGYHDKYNVTKQTLVIGRVGFYCGSIHITPANAWVTDNAFITTFSEDNISIDFLYWLLKGTNLKENDNATAQPVISGRKIYPIVVGLPPLNEQKRIVEIINSLFSICDTLKMKIEKSQEVKVTLSKTIIASAI